MSTTPDVSGFYLPPGRAVKGGRSATAPFRFCFRSKRPPRRTRSTTGSSLPGDRCPVLQPFSVLLRASVVVVGPIPAQKNQIALPSAFSD